jgi:hypothetical protein
MSMNTESPYSFLYKAGQDLMLLSGPTPLWRFHIATDHRKPFFHPIHTTSGIQLTCFEPWDHIWHRGLWFSWHTINGVNYWEESEDGGSDGITEFVGPEEVVFYKDSVTITVPFQYSSPERDVVLVEDREITIEAPDAQGDYRMDWLLTFTAQEDLTFDRVPVTEKTPWGGYGGLSWRSARSMGGMSLLNSEGKTAEATQHQRAKWVDLSGSSDGGRDLKGGMTFMDHPSNPRYPSFWKTFANDGFGYINPAFVMMEPFSLEAGESLNLFYRVFIHNGILALDQIEKEYQRFSKIPVAVD